MSQRPCFNCCSCVTASLLLFNPDLDCSGGVIEGVEPALHEESPLQAEGGNQEVESHAAKAVAFQEGHEETEPNEDHDVDILEAWRDRKKNIKSLKVVVQMLTETGNFITHYLHFV